MQQMISIQRLCLNYSCFFATTPQYGTRYYTSVHNAQYL